MKRMLALLTGAAVLLAIASCGGEKTPDDPQTLLQQAQEAMDDLSSYHAAMTVTGDNIAGSGDVIEHEWAAPDSFRSLSPMIGLEGTGACEPQRAGEARRSGCTDVRGETLEGYSENILAAHRSYFRLCREKDTDCDQWEAGDAGPLDLMGVSNDHVAWTITALTMIQGAEIIDEESVDGLPAIHVRGQLSTTQAKINTWRQAALDAGIETVGEECAAEEATPLTEGEPLPTVISTPECQPMSLEDFLASAQDDLDRQEGRPATADVWIGRDDSLVRRFSASIPPDESGEGGKDVLVEFSHFDDVTIEAPADAETP
jgi:hypothetical protein